MVRIDEYIRMRFASLATATNDFTVNLAALHAGQILDMPYVTPELLRALPDWKNIMHPKHHSVIRRAIPYLADLKQRQDEAANQIVQECLK